MKDELGRKITGEFAALSPKTYSFLTDDGDKYKKDKSIKNCVIKRKLKFKDFKHCLETTLSENKINLLKKVNLMWIVLRKTKRNA